MRDQFSLALEKEELELERVNIVALIWEAIEITKLHKINQD